MTVVVSLDLTGHVLFDVACIDRLYWLDELAHLKLIGKMRRRQGGKENSKALKLKGEGRHFAAERSRVGFCWRGMSVQGARALCAGLELVVLASLRILVSCC